MATIHEVEAVLIELADRLTTVDPALRRSLLPSPRTVELHCTDLDVSFHGHLEDGVLSSIEPGAPEHAPDIRLTGTSEDLLALANGDMRFRTAYASGQVQVEAPLADMLRFAASMPL